MDWTATYRLQLHAGFDFDAAAGIVPYLATLGVSHVYASPFFRANPGSTHGYDVVDHNAFDLERGGEAGFERFSAALKAHGMGLLADIVPNHMGIGKADNPWWLDVLEWGRDSPFANFFDIDWQPPQPALLGKVLVPFLGDHYGHVLERGELRLRFEPDRGGFSVWYYEHRFPVTVPQYGRLLVPASVELRRAGHGDAAAELDDIARRLGVLKPAARSMAKRAARRTAGLALKADLADLIRRRPIAGDAFDAACRLFNGEPGTPASFVPLHRLLEAQPYRLAFWRVTADEVNYRRFFQINELAGLRAEDPAVFEALHRTVLRLVAEGKVNGLRIDHVDGLHDPAGYLARLREAAVAAEPGDDPAPFPGDDPAPFYVVVEKVLAAHETLRPDWPVAGTTGYEFLARANGLFVDPRGEALLDRLHAEFPAAAPSFDTLLHDAKRTVMEDELSGELQVLAGEFHRLAQFSWHTRDFTVPLLRRALEAVIAHFPVYRTYVADGTCGDNDRRDIQWAVGQARKSAGLPDQTVFDFIRDVLTEDLVGDRSAGYPRWAVREAAMDVQQYTGPVMAKGLEDTSFYRWNRLLSLNEVGGDPRRFATSPAAFHHFAQERARCWPRTLSATATHDTKWGEDTRARLNVLSESPTAWARVVWRLESWGRRWRREVDGRTVPSLADSYRFYQVLLATWPTALLEPESLDGDNRTELEAWRGRLLEHMEKAVREAKVHSRWTAPDAEYEDAVRHVVGRFVDPDTARPILLELQPFARQMAWFGMLNGLAQTALKLTAPGVPDLYQGTELWDLSLVDPDNRRPVDFERRRRFLDDVVSTTDPAGLLAGWPDGRAKMFLIHRLLAVRRRLPALFEAGEYVPLEVTGVRADHVFAFLRRIEGIEVLVAIPRLFAGLGADSEAWPEDDSIWRDTAVMLPAEADPADWNGVLTGNLLTAKRQTAHPSCALDAARLFAGFPVAVFERQGTRAGP